MFEIPTIFEEQWSLRKPAVTGQNGMVSAQHYLASEVGAWVLQQGGNAMDAAVATGLALGTVEPWNSGIGGGGFMTYYDTTEKRTHVVEFGMKAPLAATSDDYPLTGGTTGDASFHWPEVLENRNVHGPFSIAIPGYIKGVSLALEKFGTWKWEDVIEPACRLAEFGLPTHWYTLQHIVKASRTMRNYEHIRNVYLADGLPPPHEDGDGHTHRIQLGNLSRTYRTLQKEGPDSYYTGSLAQLIAEDLKQTGSRINQEDLIDYEAFIDEPSVFHYRDHMVYVPRRRSAGPTLQRTLEFMERNWSSESRLQPNGDDYVMYSKALLDAYEYRLKHLGDGAIEDKLTGATSHQCVADEQGNMVTLTQTLMSGFGSHIILPQTGILMNNGMMWFDPRPGTPNSMAGGRRPLSNMCPTIACTDDGRRIAIGACGGRQIFPAIFQLLSFLCDFGMSVSDAVHQARVDVSGIDLVTIMDHMESSSIKLLQDTFDSTRVRKNGVAPIYYGVPQLIVREPEGTLSGGCLIPSPTSLVRGI